MSEERTVGVDLLRKFSPFDGMKKENLQALTHKVKIDSLAAGRVLFKEGDRDPRSYWLRSGSIELKEGDTSIAVIKAGTQEARSVLSPQLPRRLSARALEPIEFLWMDSNLLDMMITWDQTGSYEVGELSALQEGTGGEDWMTTLLQSRTFQRIPPSNIQAIFLRMQRVACRNGEVVIRQGAEGDFFYVIVSGKCAVTRETPLNRNGLLLAELGVGDTFGEEALISEAKRNATVTMISDGVLMRLSKDDFRELMNESLLRWVDYSEALDIIKKGGRWLDVRLPSEHQNVAIENSLNIPLYFIRLKLSTLDPKTKYVVYCDTGRRSAAASFVLVERGFQAYVLRGGLDNAEPSLRRSA